MVCPVTGRRLQLKTRKVEKYGIGNIIPRRRVDAAGAGRRTVKRLASIQAVGTNAPHAWGWSQERTGNLNSEIGSSGWIQQQPSG